MQNEQQPPHRHAGIKFDLTVNIPGMLMIGGAMVSGVFWLSSVDAKASLALATANEAKQAQATQTASTSREIAVVRTELRDDLKDINSKVDQIIWRLGDSPKNLSDWTKK